MGKSIFEGVQIVIEMDKLAAHCWIRRNKFSSYYNLFGFIEINGSAVIEALDYDKEKAKLTEKINKIQGISNIELHNWDKAKFVSIWAEIHGVLEINNKVIRNFDQPIFIT